MMTTVIAGGLIADGTGAPLRKADIAVSDGRVVEIGEGLRGDYELNAQGAVAAPGFIDIHTHYDAQLFWDPACTSSSWHGVTSAVIGNCGFGLAPCRPENRPRLIRMLVEQEDMPGPVLEAGIDWSFSTFPEYLDAIARLRPSINIAAYAGHSPVRIEVMGDAAYERAATDEEISQMSSLVQEAMAAGAIGFASTSSPSGRRSATGHADEREIVALGRAMGSSGRGVMALVPGGVSLSRARMYEIQPGIGRPITWTAIMAMPDGSHREWAALHRAHNKLGAKVHPQVSGRPQVAMTTMRSAFALRTTSMLALEGRPEAERIKAFRDPSWRSKVVSEYGDVRFPVSWDRWVLAESPTAPQLVGQSLLEIAAARGASPLDALFDLALEDDLSTRYKVTQFNYQESEVVELLSMEGAVLGLADSGAHPDQICDAVLPSDFLGKWVRDKKVMPLEKGVRKLTGEPADLFGLDRGYIRVGAPADITVFEPDTVAPGPVRRISDLPAGGDRLVADQPAGIRHILVNGQPVRVSGEQITNKDKGGPGVVLRGK